MAPWDDFTGTEANDAGLLQVIASIRATADELASHIARHNGQHPAHGITECALGLLNVSRIMEQAAVGLAVSARNMREEMHDGMRWAIGYAAGNTHLEPPPGWGIGSVVDDDDGEDGDGNDGTPLYPPDGFR